MTADGDAGPRGLDLGIMLPTIGGEAGPEGIGRLAESAERLGFNSVWVGDHVVFPADIDDEYPFTDSGDPPAAFDAASDLYTPLETLAYVAAVTDSVSLGTNVCLAPLRHPVALTKSVLTTAALADWRFQFGVGLGWLTAEYDVLDVPLAERGSRLDEFLSLFRRACAEGQLSFDGPHHSFEEVGFHPSPDGDDIPIWVGGRSGATFRRVAEHGDGWTTVGESPADIEAARPRLRRAWADFDRPGDPDVGVTCPVDIREPGEPTDGPLVGPPSAVAADVEAYCEAGVTHLVFMFYTTDADAQVAQLERFASDVAPRIDPDTPDR